MKSPVVLCVAPHADDAEMGCGGYLHRVRDAARTVIAPVFMSDIRMAHSGHTATVFERQKESGQGATRLGAWLDLDLVTDAENEGPNAPRGDLVAKLDAALRRWQPQTLLIPLPSFNQDHRVLFEACLAATRPGLGLPCEVLAYEYPGSCWGTPGHGEIAGKTYAPIGEADLNAKLRACLEHRSQFAGRSPGLMHIDGVDALARMRGLECGARHAELFYRLRGFI